MSQGAQKAEGFSLLEVLISLLILLVISGASFSALETYQKHYRSTQLQADMHRSLRAALELMTQEIGQAGLLGFTARQLSAGVTSGTAAQSVAISSTTGIFVGEKLLVDTGASQETVSVTSVGTGTITAVFTKSHASGALISAAGVFPQGVLSSSTATSLKIFGDINGDGEMVYVQYDCDTTAGTLARSSTAITASSISPAQIVVQNLIANPGGTPCFQYATATAGGYTFVTSVGITLSIRTAFPDPQTNQYVTMTKSFLNLAPRNVIAGLTLAQENLQTNLQPTPPGLPLN